MLYCFAWAEMSSTSLGKTASKSALEVAMVVGGEGTLWEAGVIAMRGVRRFNGSREVSEVGRKMWCIEGHFDVFQRR
jgi:hypothetical protein